MSLQNPHQSAYCKHHSTETDLVYIHDHLINAIGSQKNILPLPTRPIHGIWHHDHDILITRLSCWFGIHARPCLKLVQVIPVFPFFSRSMQQQPIPSSHVTSSCGVPQGSVLGPILFTMYTTQLSTLISSQSLNHRLYADDTQLFFSFYPPDLHSSIMHFYRASAYCCWRAILI